MRDPLPLVQQLGERLSHAEVKALVLLVGMSRTPAQDLGAALGAGDDLIEECYVEARSKLAEPPGPKRSHGVVP